MSFDNIFYLSIMFIQKMNSPEIKHPNYFLCFLFFQTLTTPSVTTTTQWDKLFTTSWKMKVCVCTHVFFIIKSLNQLLLLEVYLCTASVLGSKYLFEWTQAAESISSLQYLSDIPHFVINAYENITGRRRKFKSWPLRNQHSWYLKVVLTLLH